MKKLPFRAWLRACLRFFVKLLPLASAYFLVEVFAAAVIQPEEYTCLAFGALWAVILASVVRMLPALPGKILFGITYYVYLFWSMAQMGYYCVFRRMLWIKDAFFAGEGAAFFGDVLAAFPPLWWIGGVLMIALGVFLIWKFPRGDKHFLSKTVLAAVIAASVVGLCLLPEVIFLKDLGIWGTRSEYAQSSSYRATYNTMYDAKNVYDICGVYQLAFRDIWVHQLYPLTPAYQQELKAQTQEINDYFNKREPAGENEMTGLFAGKHVVLVLMESMDDWMINQTDTPTIYQMMKEGIQFTNFYTPGYGTARTINSEFCVNTGIYLPTTGDYVFDYVTNAFNQSIASRAVANGATAEVFHYNSPDFYSRGVFEPAMGYNAYNCYEDYETDKDRLYDDCLLFDIPELNDLFFREGTTFNTIITRSAHLSYVYNEVLSHYALKKYPEYRGMYDSQEEDCARVKAKLVDDMFARLVAELKEKGRYEDTVIIGVTDHYTYGYKDLGELMALSNVTEELLLEKTPCFVWSPDCPTVTVDKTLNTADFLPTMLNLLGYETPYHYLGQDAFDPSYEGYALFPNGSWISDGVACQVTAGGGTVILQNLYDKDVSDEYLQQMAERSREFIRISNLLLTADYYKNIQ